MNFNDKHPELEDGEMFLTNECTGTYPKIGWKSKRKGITAYTINGKVIGIINGMFPIFIQKKEFDDYFKSKEAKELNKYYEL